MLTDGLTARQDSKDAAGMVQLVDVRSCCSAPSILGRRRWEPWVSLQRRWWPIPPPRSRLTYPPDEAPTGTPLPTQDECPVPRGQLSNADQHRRNCYSPHKGMVICDIPRRYRPCEKVDVNTLEEWTQAVTAELGLDQVADRDVVLDLARDVAHGVARPAAPLTTYLAGLAVGAGQDASDVAARITRLAAGWAPQE